MRDYEYSDLYFDAHLDKQMRIEVLGTGITIDNSMVELDAFELDEMLCSEQELIFGSCEANCVKFTARDMPGSIVGKTIRITETVDGNTDVPFQYGIYKVYSDVPSSDRTKREITAYDAMYDIVNADVKSWYADLSFPMAMRQFRDSFFAHFGIIQKETTLVNDGMVVNKTLVATQTDPDSTITEEPAISGKTIVTAICEINGVFGNINRDGEFEYVELKEIISPLYPANDLYPSDDLFPRDPNTISMTGHYIKFDYEDFQTKQITQLEIRPSEESAGATVGTSGNNYVISGNFLVSDKTGTELEEIAANTLSIIRKASYTPLKSSDVVGNPCIELGDPIRFNTTREIIESYVLQRTLTGIQNKRDSIVSPGTEMYKQNPNSIRDQISSVEKRTNKLERTADHTLSEIKAVDSKVDTLDGSVKESVSEMNSKIEQTATSITSEVNAKVTEINKDIASVDGKVDDLSQSVAASETELSSKIDQTAEQIKSEVTRATGAEETLRSSIEQTAGSVRTEISDRQNADAEMSSLISQTANEIASEVTARQNADSEMSTKISQNAQAIEAEVSARGNADNDIYGQLALKISNTDDGTIISLINASADKIHFNANNMFTVNAQNIVIDEDGNVELGGEITADTFLCLCYQLAASGNRVKTKVMEVSLDQYKEYSIDKSSRPYSSTYTTYGSSIYSPVLKIGGDVCAYIKFTKQANMDSAYVDNLIANESVLWNANIGNLYLHSAQPSESGVSGNIYGCNGGYGTEGIASAGYVQSYVSKYTPSTDDFAPKNHSHSEYLSENHYGDVYVSNDVCPGHTLYCSNYGNLSRTSNVAGFSATGYLCPSSGSSERFKHCIRPLQTYDARLLYELDIDEFIYNEGYLEGSDDWYQKIVPGFIAEKMEMLLPIAVSHDEYGRPNGWKEKAVIPLMLALIQEQHKDIELLKQENLALQNRVSILEQKMEELENVINNKINQS